MPWCPPHFALFALLAAWACVYTPPALHAQLTRVANTTLNLPATLPSPTGYATENALGTLTFSQPLSARSIPGVGNVLYVVEKGGTIQRVDLDTNTKALFLNLAGYLSSNDGDPATSMFTTGESGLLGMAVHPDFVNNGYFYVTYTLNTSGGVYWRLTRFQATGTPGSYHLATGVNEVATHQPIISQRDQNNNHNGGDLAFGPDGYLYVSTGDEGDSNDSRNNSRFINKDFFAAILRIDVDIEPAGPGDDDSLPPNTAVAPGITFTGIIHPGTYEIPADNPFIGRTEWNNGTMNPGDAGYNTFPANTVRTEIYATGLRNPWRMSFDEPTGRLFVGDVGQASREEINIVTAGKDYGWAYREGSQHFSPSANVIPRPTGYYIEPPGDTSKNPVDPIYDYVRLSGNSVTGGYVYRGSRLTELIGKYIFADHGSGQVTALTEVSPGSWTATLLHTVSNVAGFALDPRNGDLLLCRIGTGTIGRLVRTFGAGTPPPQTLSGTGAFSDLATLTPHAGIVVYEPNVSFWSDHAIKERWFSIPNTADDMSYSRDGNWTFPNGQVWIKHFEIELERGVPASARRLETRFIVKNAAGAYGLTYKWRANGSEADLVGAEGLDETLNIIDGGNPVQQVWRYPSRAECMQCHTAAAGYALSFNTRQMNRDHTYGAETQNQLLALLEAGYFTASPPLENVHTLPALARADDASKSLEWRVRSYLAANCAQCHQPGGGGLGSWDARPHLTTAQTGIINGTLSDTGNDPDYRLAVPGDPDLSMILDRIRSLNPPSGLDRMPPIGSNAVDAEGAALVEDWIELELPAHQTFAQWQVAEFGSVDHPDAQPEDDPDGDGQDNEREFLARTDPEAPSAPPEVSVTADPVGGMLEVSFTPVFNRGMVIEASSDLTLWDDWNVPGNEPNFAALGASLKTLSVPLDPGETELYFRARLEEL